MAIDFQQALDDFSIGGSTSDPISAIYDIIPTYSMYQQKLLFVVKYFVAKYQLDDIDASIAIVMIFIALVSDLKKFPKKIRDIFLLS